MKRILIIGVIFLSMFGCLIESENNVATPLPPDKPGDYTPAPTADYSEW